MTICAGPRRRCLDHLHSSRDWNSGSIQRQAILAAQTGQDRRSLARFTRRRPSTLGEWRRTIPHAFEALKVESDHLAVVGIA